MKTRLLFVGDGPEIRRLRTEVSVDESVEFTGYQPDISASMARCDLGLLPSYFTAESLPNVIIEFQAQGKPVIATQVGGIPEMLVHDGQPCGIIIPISPSTGRADVAALASAMRRMMEDSDLCNRAAVSARAAFARYSPERCSMAYTRFFEEVCQKA
jgi:glycosyltransferase involved in cell wall biosynthesis